MPRSFEQTSDVIRSQLCMAAAATVIIMILVSQSELGVVARPRYSRSARIGAHKLASRRSQPR